MKQSLQGQEGTEPFRKMKNVYIEICSINDIYFQSAWEVYFLGFHKDQNVKLYNFSSNTNYSGDNRGGTSITSKVCFQSRWT